MTDDGLTHAEIQELLGAYALDAVDDRERAIIEAHLKTCETCPVELLDHRRLAQTLRRHAVRVSPLASTVSNGIRGTKEDVGPGERMPRWWALVALAIVVVLLAGMFIQEQVRINHLEATSGRTELMARAQLAAIGPEAVVTALRTPRNVPVLTVVSLAAGGAGYAISSTLPSLARGQAYQLWSTANGTVTATASLGRRPDIGKFTVPAGVTEFLVTIEQNKVPVDPTLPAVATGLVSPG